MAKKRPATRHKAVKKAAADQKVIAPDYYARFHCIGGDCEDNCCTAGWRIDIDRSTWLRYQSCQNEAFAPLLREAIDAVHACGARMALDDFGDGRSSLRLWSELRPDYVKIDRHFIDGIHQDAVKREFVESILKMARASRAQVIARRLPRRASRLP